MASHASFQSTFQQRSDRLSMTTGCFKKTMVLDVPHASSAAKLLQYWFFVLQVSVQETTYDPGLTAARFSLFPSLRENVFHKTRRGH